MNRIRNNENSLQPQAFIFSKIPLTQPKVFSYFKNMNFFEIRFMLQLIFMILQLEQYCYFSTYRLKYL